MTPVLIVSLAALFAALSTVLVLIINARAIRATARIPRNNAAPYLAIMQRRRRAVEEAIAAQIAAPDASEREE